MADDMDMDFCCRGPRKKMYEDLDLDFCCRGEDVYENEDECDDLVSLEDAVEDSIDTVAADSPAAPLTSSTAHDIIAKPVERHRIVPDLESALPQGKSIEAPVVVAPSKATLSDKPSRSSSRLSQEGTP
jgi:iron-sulfur cluster repair protein YtfE (RIC family)